MKEALINLASASVTFLVAARTPGARKTEVQALKNINLEINQGVSLGVVGESGCGKSTLARVLCGLQPLTSGSIRSQGRAANPGELRLLSQMVFQDPFSSLNPRLKIWIQVSEPLRGLRKVKEKDLLRERAEEVLHQVGLENTALEKYPHQFSGGQRQRIALARALAIQPRIIVADEALSSLDVQSQAQILELLKDLKSTNTTFVLISHDFSHVHALADQVAVINRGEIVERGATSELLRQPSHPYTKTLLSAIPRMKM